MKSDFLLAITQLSAEKNLPKEVILQAVESALVSAYKKDTLTGGQNISVQINSSTGEVKVYAQKLVTDAVTDPRLEISLADAHRIKKDIQLGETLQLEIISHNAGRIAAQTAKQVVLQRLKEAERDAIYVEFVGREGDVISGVVQRIEPKQVFIDLGRTEAVLPSTEQVRGERYRIGQRLKLYLLEASRTGKGPQVIVSRSHPNLLRRLFELEIPEIHNGLVEVKAIAWEAGNRGKVAVAAKQQGVDPVGCCVGQRGIRIQNIVNELGGIKLDVVQWHSNPTTFIASALSPAQVSTVKVDMDTKTATVIVPDRQLSLAIGKEGQNARLDIVQEQRTRGVPIFFGDATQEASLLKANIKDARVCVVAIPDSTGTARVVSLARRLNPGVHIVARVRYVRDMARLYALGANEVVSEETEASIKIFTVVLEKFDVDPDVIEGFGGVPLKR